MFLALFFSCLSDHMLTYEIEVSETEYIDRIISQHDVYIDNSVEETIIIEDSSVGVKAGVAANVKVIGLTAGGHWFKERNNKELFDAGATDVTDDFNKIISLIEKY